MKSNVPMCPESWRSLVLPHHEKSDRHYAREAGLAEDGYRAAALQTLRTLLHEPRIYLRTFSDRLANWLDQGSYDTVFETANDPRSSEYRDRRRTVEEHVLGVAPDGLRPRYGYLHGSDNARLRSAGYGPVVVELSQTLHASATVTLGDSMLSTHEGSNQTMAPELLSSPQLTCRHSYTNIVSSMPTLVSACDPSCAYAEVQIYDSLDPRDIVFVTFAHGTPAPIDLATALKNRGIGYTEIDGDLPQ